MTTRHHLHDAGHCLRAAAPPILTLAVLTVTRSVLLTSPTPSAAVGHFLPVLGAAFVAAAVWFVAAVCWAATRPLRDRRAFQRLQHLREIAADPDRVLVHVQTVVWSSAAGQQVVVVNVATGETYRVWLPEGEVPVGAFALVEQRDLGVAVIDWVGRRTVEAAHLYKHRHPDHGEAAHQAFFPSSPEYRDDVRRLIEEAEQFLKDQG